MNAFAECSKVEQESLRRLQPWLEFASGGRYVVTHKGRLAKLLQEQVGDVILNGRENSVWSLEAKAEQENKHGNFFLESWSNKSRFNPGWFWKIDADVLLYHFLSGDEVYVMRLAELRRWCFEHDRPGRWRISQWPERLQSKHDQLNDTWGYCVPIRAVLAGVPSAKRIYLPEAAAA